MDLGEFELIGRIVGKAESAGRFETGIGDDAAVIRTRGRIVTSVDSAVEGVHFDRQRPPAENARKAVAGAVSDLAAMGLGAGDTEILVALGAPPETPDRYLEGLADGVIEAAEEFGVELAGGDVVAAPVIFLSVTVIAHLDGEAPVVGRSGARPGDVVAVTGPVGGAAAGLKLVQGLEVPELSDLARDLLVECQVRPQPQLAAAPVLARAGATAMIDVSDGLVADLGHIAASSGVAIRLEAGEIPIVPGVREVATTAGADPLEFAVAGGEDYVLALTIPQERFEAADTALIEATGFELLAVGAVEAAAGGQAAARIVSEDGSQVVAPGGHDHFRGPAAGSR
ncbi:MAG: thiamine-phosphate kinase [Solirubrobacterales bacterium]|nr:thiamine-phosphate kinase [Solirubrobacterales bacterium]OJU96148.1 MAG: thiamine-phosphate kinase [Solirubrobacterales bacterium 67-14]